MSNLAPIVLFVYARPEHTRRTLEALAASKYAENSDLIVYSDAARNETDEIQVKAVRDLVREITGFRTMKIIEREKNYGLANSIVEGVTQACELYGRAIVLEDDIIVSPFFLDYVNNALEYYENDERVISIGCYTFPLSIPIPDTFFLKIPDCWGWAVWKRSWDLFETDGKKLLDEIREQGREFEFDLDGAYPYTKMLIDQTMGKNDSWAIRWYARAFLLNKLTLYPGSSMTKNIGMDNSGIHCGSTEHYDVVTAKECAKVNSVTVEENVIIRKAIGKFLRKQRKDYIGKLRRFFVKFKNRFMNRM